MKRPQTKNPKPTRPRQLSRRQIWTLATIGGGAFVLMLALVVFLSLPHRLTAAERVMLEQYESIRVALAQDNLAAAQSAASQLSGSFPGNEKIANASRAVANAASLEEARERFKILSNKVIPLARGNDGYFIVGCPMGTCPAPCVNCQMSRFGDWVQSTATVGNPFLGAAARRCGAVKQ